MDLKPVWISSISHLDAFTKIGINTPRWRKLLGFYDIPNNFPRINLYYIFRFPIVFFSEGKLNIENNKVSYESLKKNTAFLTSYSNLMNNLSFEINISDIESLERFQNKNSFINYYSIEWIRIKCNNNILNGDFLVCVGGKGPLMSKVNKSTENLFQKLIKLQNHKVD